MTLLRDSSLVRPILLNKLNNIKYKNTKMNIPSTPDKSDLLIMKIRHEIPSES